MFLIALYAVTCRNYQAIINCQNCHPIAYCDSTFTHDGYYGSTSCIESPSKDLGVDLLVIAVIVVWSIINIINFIGAIDRNHSLLY